MNHLSLYADPLGDLYVEWKITEQKPVVINLPNYKYEMSNLLGIPVPFSSIAEKLESEVFKIYLEKTPAEEIPYTMQKDFHGANSLLTSAPEAGDVLVIQYVIRNLVTRDKIFFNFVFTLASPLAEPITAAIELKARFSYDINSYKLKTQLIGKGTGRITGAAELLRHELTGDFITAYGEGIVLGDDLMDLHVHGSRLPFMIDRRLFWLVIFAIAIIGVGTLFSILKLK
jgi:hypothetical protein